MDYEKQLFTEAVSVGGMVVVVNKLYEKMFPRASPTLRLFLVGMSIHLGFEYVGANEWYLKNGAVLLKKHRQEEEKKKWIRKHKQQQQSSFFSQYSSSTDGFILSL